MRMNRSLAGAALAIGLLATVQPGQANAQTVWDLSQLAGSGGFLGSSHTFLNGLIGGVTAYSLGSGISLYAKDFGSPLSDAEKGLGVCKNTANAGTNCSGDNSDHEIGDFEGDGIVLDLNLNPGFKLDGFRLGSVQAGEGWGVFYMTSATCNASTNFSSASEISGTGPSTGEFRDLTGFGTADCFKFIEPGPNDFLLQSLTTESGGGRLEDPVPEPGTMSLLAFGIVGMAGAARRRRKK